MPQNPNWYWQMKTGKREKECLPEYWQSLIFPLAHLIKNGEVWLQHDATDAEIANQLVEMGVPKKDIVLAFYTENHRRYTGFAVK